MRIKKERSIALIIDVQEKLFPFIHENEQLSRNICILIEGLKILSVPVYVTEQYTKGLGGTIEPVASLVKGLPGYEKSSFSCCDDPVIMESIALSGKEFVIVAGIESHVCVMQTVLDLKQNGYTPVVVEDCVSSRTAANKATAIHRMRQEGAIITTYESLLFELLMVSGTEQFKAISKLVK